MYYLQLDGVTYKLVPIRTPVDKGNPFDMGRIDADKMYDIVMNFDWGNSGSDAIYHDPETRRNSITYRGNLARLIEQLIKEDKLDKAEEIADIAMTNMPLEYYGFYAFVEPYVDGYYKVGETEKARDLFYRLRNIYQDRLDYYSSIPLDEQYDNIEDIIGDMEAYRRNIDILIENNDRELAEKETLIFNEHIDRFSHFYKDEILEEPPLLEQSNPDMRDTSPLEGDSVSGNSLDSGMELDTVSGGN